MGFPKNINLKPPSFPKKLAYLSFCQLVLHFLVFNSYLVNLRVL